MLTVTQESKSDHVLVTLVGVVDEEADFSEIQSALAVPMRIDCSGIKRFNSTGIKAWMIAFDKLRASRIQFEFISCPPIFVEQLNSFSNFSRGGKIRSIQVPFACKCGNQFCTTVGVETLKPPVTEVGDQPCPKCKAMASFDDLAEEYFAFLKR